MALQAELLTNHGESRSVYIRLNNIDNMTKHTFWNALFRGYISKEAFEGNWGYCWELVVSFKGDENRPAREQAYEALRAYDPTVEIEENLRERQRDVDLLSGKLQEEDSAITEAEEKLPELRLLREKKIKEESALKKRRGESEADFTMRRERLEEEVRSLRKQVTTYEAEIETFSIRSAATRASLDNASKQMQSLHRELEFAKLLKHSFASAADA